LVLCFLATSVNPYGYALHQHILEHLRHPTTYALSAEFQSPNFHLFPVQWFEGLLILSLLLGAWSLREWNFVPLLLVVFFGHLSLYSVRNIPLAVLIMTPIIATYFPRVFHGLMESTAARAGLDRFIQHMGRLSRDLAGMEKTLIGHWLPIALA